MTRCKLAPGAPNTCFGLMVGAPILPRCFEQTNACGMTAFCCRNGFSYWSFPATRPDYNSQLPGSRTCNLKEEHLPWRRQALAFRLVPIVLLKV